MPIVIEICSIEKRLQSATIKIYRALEDTFIHANMAR